MFAGTNFYGIKKILLSYAGLPFWLPFPVAVQHGWQRVSTSFEKSTSPPEIWVWSDRIREDYLLNDNGGNIRCIGAPFLYLLEDMKLEREAIHAGSICMPPHSSHLTELEYSTKDFIESVKLLGSDYFPVVAMLYYLDLKPTIVSAFESQNISTVSNGSLYDYNFLTNFIRNVDGKKYCIYTEIGSGNFFCTFLGIRSVRVVVDVKHINQGNVHFSSDVDGISKFKKDDDFYVEKINDINFVRDELGYSRMLTRREMRWLILRNIFTINFIFHLCVILIGKFTRIIKLIFLTSIKN